MLHKQRVRRTSFSIRLILVLKYLIFLTFILLVFDPLSHSKCDRASEQTPEEICPEFFKTLRESLDIMQEMKAKHRPSNLEEFQEIFELITSLGELRPQNGDT